MQCNGAFFLEQGEQRIAYFAGGVYCTASLGVEVLGELHYSPAHHTYRPCKPLRCHLQVSARQCVEHGNL
ncbi:hypothetical protein D3C81_2308440 [compost metagenome]